MMSADVYVVGMNEEAGDKGDDDVVDDDDDDDDK